MDLKRVGGGLLVQSPDDHRAGGCGPARGHARSSRPPQQLADLLFAWQVAHFVKSNAIVFCGGGQTLGVGAGQMSRVDSARIASIKAANAGLSLTGSAVASDAFFPFRDGLDVVVDAGADRGDPAGRLDARPGSDRRRQRTRRGDGVHRSPALPALIRRMRILGIDPGLRVTGFGLVDAEQEQAHLPRQRRHPHRRRQPAGAAAEDPPRHRRTGRGVPAGHRGLRDRLRQRQSEVDAAARPGPRRRHRRAGQPLARRARIHRAAGQAGAWSATAAPQEPGADDGAAPAAAAGHCLAGCGRRAGLRDLPRPRRRDDQGARHAHAARPGHRLSGAAPDRPAHEAAAVRAY